MLTSGAEERSVAERKVRSYRIYVRCVVQYVHAVPRGKEEKIIPPDTNGPYEEAVKMSWSRDRSVLPGCNLGKFSDPQRNIACQVEPAGNIVADICVSATMAKVARNWSVGGRCCTASQCHARGFQMTSSLHGRSPPCSKLMHQIALQLDGQSEVSSNGRPSWLRDDYVFWVSHIVSEREKGGAHMHYGHCTQSAKRGIATIWETGSATRYSLI